MARFVFISALLAWSGTGLAVTPPYVPEMWVEWSDAVVVGTVLSVESADSREIEGHHSDGWFFPHDVARIEIAEVLKGSPKRCISVGDTISLFYATSGEGKSFDEPNLILSASDAEMKPLLKGLEGAFSLRIVRGEWRSRIWCYYRDMSLVPEIRSAVERLSARERTE